MRAYMAYSAFEGSQEGAALVIANTVKEAKHLAYPCLALWNVDGWIDLEVRWMRDDDIMVLANQEKLKAGISHVIDNPVSCVSCELWGHEVHAKGKDATCSYCGEYPGDELVKLYGLEQSGKAHTD